MNSICMYCRFIPHEKKVEEIVAKALKDFDSEINLAEFVDKLDLSSLESLLLREYENDFHFRFNPISIAKAIILKELKGTRSFEELYNYLSNPRCSQIIRIRW